MPEVNRQEISNKQLPKVPITEEILNKVRNKIDRSLLEESDLGSQLTTLREITGETNGSLSERLRVKKRTFESWVSGRYDPEKHELKKINSLLIMTAIMYIEAILKHKKPRNAYDGFPPSSPCMGESGCTLTNLMSSLCSRKRLPVPVNVPLVPRPATKCVSSPPVCSMISNAVPS